MGNDSKAKTQIKRIAFLNCHTAKLFTADVDMSESEEVALASMLAWLQEAGVVMLPAAEGPAAPIAAADFEACVRRTVGDCLVDAALDADPERPAAGGSRPIAVMPVWPFEDEGDASADRDVLLSSGRLWGADILLEALRVEDPDNPVPVTTVRCRHDRWVKAAGGAKLRAFVHLPGEQGCYFVGGAAAAM